MAICRFSDPDCDAYIYETDDDLFVIHAGPGSESFELPGAEAIVKVQELRAKGVRIPSHVEEGIQWRVANPASRPQDSSPEAMEKADEVFSKFKAGQQLTTQDLLTLQSAGLL